MYFSYIFCYALLVALATSSSFEPPDILWLDEGEVCKKSIFAQANHECKVLDECKTAIQDIRDNVAYPTICSFRGKMPVVCCAPEWMSREDRLSKVKASKIIPGITLYFESYKNDIVKDNLIEYNSRPRRVRRQVLSRRRP